MNNMENKIQLETRNAGGVEYIRILDLNSYKIRRIEGLTSKFRSLTELYMSNVGLTTLENFPKLKNLLKLNLSSNGLKTGLEYIIHCRKIRNLNIAHNGFNADALQPLKHLKHLQVLEMYLNEVKTDYSQRMFTLIPSLKYVDSYDKSDIPIPSDAEEDLTFKGVSEEEDSDEEDLGEKEEIEPSTSSGIQTNTNIAAKSSKPETGILSPRKHRLTKTSQEKSESSASQSDFDEEAKSPKPKNIVQSIETEKETSETEDVLPEAKETDTSPLESESIETQKEKFEKISIDEN